MKKEWSVSNFITQSLNHYYESRSNFKERNIPGIAVIHLTIINLQIEVDFQSTVKKHTKLENSNIDCLD